MKTRPKLLCLLLAAIGPSHAMQSLSDGDMAQVTGQDGMTVQSATDKITLDAFRYIDDGNAVALEGISVDPSQGQTKLLETSTFDVNSASELEIHTVSQPRKAGIAAIRVGGGANSFGQFAIDYSADTLLKIKGGGANGSTGINFDGSNVNYNIKQLAWTANGQTLKFNDITHAVALNNAKLDILANGLQLDLGNSVFTSNIGSITFNNGTASYGKFDNTLNLAGTLRLSSGGATGSDGMRFYPNISFSNSQFKYTDVDTVTPANSGVVWASNLSGNLISNSGVSVDVLPGAVELGMPDLTLNANLGSLVLGNPAGQKLGSFDLNLQLQDVGVNKNYLRLAPGGDAAYGTQGITADIGFNMVDSWLGMTDNNNQIWFSGLKGNGAGQLTVSFSCAGASAPCRTTDYDGVRLGFNSLQGSYSFDGMRVGSKTAPLQGGSELLLAAEFFPAYDFKVKNGSWMSFSPGGAAGNGVTINSDMAIISDGSFTSNAALTVDENGKGLWLTGLNYEMHTRGGKLDVTQNGLEIKKGEYWSRLDAKDVKSGTKLASNPNSMGRLVLRRYENGSTLTVRSGGAGALCIGADAASSAACTTAGGRWEDRGNEGFTVSLKNLLSNAHVNSTLDPDAAYTVDRDKRNQLMWESNRDGTGKGTRLIFDNITTNDGTGVAGGSNNYGLNVDMNIDVAPTSVKVKEGWACIGAGTCGPAGSDYKVAGLDPLGFAVNGRIHFKELNVGGIYNQFRGNAPEQAMYGLKIQNANINANLTATPFSR